ncbi:MAG: lysophospholipase [Candidatus Fimenecus sp.]
MENAIKTYTFPSCSGIGDIHAKCLCPQNETVKAVVQISHGMAEHSARYLPFAEYLCAHGFAVVLHDHIGHGQSVASREMLGYFGEHGEQTFVEDMKTVTDWAITAYPNLPLFLLGHGMGSLIARKYTAQYGDLLAGAVYSGTSGSNPALGFGLLLCDMLIKIKGAKHRSKLLDKIAFGAYNKKTEKRTPCDWASRDEKEVDKFIADPLCGYMYTVSGMQALFLTVQEISKDSWYASIPQHLPILLISGSMDPIGGYGKGVREVFSRLQRSGHKAVQIKLYDGARHEILNEINREAVFTDILSFFSSNL